MSARRVLFGVPLGRPDLSRKMVPAPQRLELLRLCWSEGIVLIRA
ncbi:hypothetical protein [Sphingomonas parapaucimobilis]